MEANILLLYVLVGLRTFPIFLVKENVRLKVILTTRDIDNAFVAIPYGQLCTEHISPWAH